MTDYYKVLGISRDANPTEIKAAFRKLALRFHPDRHVNGSEQTRQAASRRFKELSEAYEVLGDEKKRAVYNRTGRTEYRGPRHTRSQSYRRTASEEAWRGHHHHEEPFHTRGFSREARPRAPFRWKLGFTKADLLLHGAFLTVAVVGFTLADEAVDSIWKKRNPGKSFEEVIESVEREKKNKADQMAGN